MGLLGMELRFLYLQGKWFTNWANPKPLYLLKKIKQTKISIVYIEVSKQETQSF